MTTLLAMNNSGRQAMMKKAIFSPRSRKTLKTTLLLLSSSSSSCWATSGSSGTRMASSSSSSSSPVSRIAAFQTAPCHDASRRKQRDDECRRSSSFFSSLSWPSSRSSSSSSSSLYATPPLQSMNDLADQLAQNSYNNIVVVVGAGASVNAGIPDFRTPGTGLYDQLQDYNLPYPEAIFDLDFFATNPQPFNNLATQIWPGQAGGPRPTMTHAFMKLLQDAKMLKRIYTQNIDGLESLAGLSDERLVECHGHFRSTSCISCGTPMAATQFQEVLSTKIPTCQACGSLVKPDIVFYGEELPKRFQRLVHDDARDCDLLIVIGTSLLINPVAKIPSWVPRDCPRVLFNKEIVGDFDQDHPMDLILQGDCDDNIRQLCQLAGWETNLDSAHQEVQ